MKQLIVLWFCGVNLLVGGDITRSVYNLGNTNQTQNEVFYVKSVSTYSGIGKTFTQKYDNGTLIFGNSTQTKGMGEIYFGSGGFLGYINANFSSNTLYLTGSLGAGNYAKTGGGLRIRFQAKQATLQDWKLNLNPAGLQNSYANISVQGSLKAENVALVDQSQGSIEFNANAFDFHAKNLTSNGKVVFKSLTESPTQSNRVSIDFLSINGGSFQASIKGHLMIQEIQIQSSGFETEGMYSDNLDWGSLQDVGNFKTSFIENQGKLILVGKIKTKSDLRFQGKTLEAQNSNIEIKGVKLDSLKVRGKAHFGDLLFENALGDFHSLTLSKTLSLQSSKIMVQDDFHLKGKVKIFLKGQELSPIVVKGQTAITTQSHNPIFEIYNLSDLKGVKLGTEYPILTSEKGIVYPSSGDFFDFLAFFDQNQQRIDDDRTFQYEDLVITKFKGSNSLGFKIDVVSNFNPYNKNQIHYWIFKKGGEDLLQSVRDTGSSTLDVLQSLMIDNHGSLWVREWLNSHDEGDLLRIGTGIQDTINQLTDLQRKVNNLELLEFATRIAKNNHLALLSDPSLEHQRYLWAALLSAGGVNEWGNGLLSGLSVGYDYLINHLIVGSYIAYGFDLYRGGWIENQSHNVGLGLYTRFLLGGHELDFGVIGMLGWNDERIKSDEPVITPLNQTYNYNSKSIKVNFDYGYSFGFFQESLVFKPIASVSYTYLTTTELEGESDKKENRQFGIVLNPEDKHSVALKLAIETRGYLNKHSFWWLSVGASKEVFHVFSSPQTMRFASQNLGVLNSSLYGLGFDVSLGGEVRPWKSTAIYFNVGSSLGVNYNDKKLAGNVGIEYLF